MLSTVEHISQIMNQSQVSNFCYPMNPDSDYVALLVRDRGSLSEQTIQDLFTSIASVSPDVPRCFIRARSFSQALPYLKQQATDRQLTVVHTNSLREKDKLQYSEFIDRLSFLYHLDCFVPGTNAESFEFRQQAEQGKKSIAKELQRANRKLLFPKPVTSISVNFRVSVEVYNRIRDWSNDDFVRAVESDLA